MSALSDAVALVQADFATLSQEITDNAAAANAEIAALAAAIAGGNTADVQAAVDNLTALNASMTTAAATLKTDTDAMSASLQASMKK